jgi:hypothetical protein
MHKNYRVYIEYRVSDSVTSTAIICGKSKHGIGVKHLLYDVESG